MIRSRRMLFVLAAILALTLASRSDPLARLARDLLGPSVMLYLPAQTAQRGADVRPAAGEQGAVAGSPATAAGQPRRPASTVPSALAAVTAGAAAKPEQGYVLRARLTTSDAKPMNQVTVSFYELVELLGEREMLIGSATTDGQGRASLTYLPAVAGQREILIRSSASGSVAPVEGRATFVATVAAPAYHPEGRPLARFADAVPSVVGVIVLAVWALIGFALLGTARGVAVEARLATRSNGTARGVAARARLATKKEDPA